MTIPNIISIGRLIMSLVMVIAALVQSATIFLTAFCISLVSDFVDGFLARHLHQESRVGAVLDTCGDVTMYLAAAIGGWLLWPGIMRQEAVYMITALSLVGISALLSLLKHRKLPSYHTWTAKFSTALIGIAALLMFAGLSTIPFRVSVLALAIAMIEESAITLILPTWRPDVRSLFDALKRRRQSR